MRIPGIARVSRWIDDRRRRAAPRGVVLLYHRIAGPRRDPQWLDVRPSYFDEQMALLARRYTPLALDEFEARRRRGTLPPRAVAVTFDDGYADNLLTAAPILTRHAVPATVFIAAGMIGADREFWWDEIERVAFESASLSADGAGGLVSWTDDGVRPTADDRWNVAAATDPTARHRLYRSLATLLQSLPSATRDAHVEALRQWAGLPAAARASHRTLTRDELIGLAATPGITIGAHTMTHPSLARLAADEQWREWTASRDWLREATGQPVSRAAYPYGSPSDANAATAAVAATCGFDAAYIVAAATAWRGTAAHLIPRCLVRDWDAATLDQQLERWFAA